MDALLKEKLSQLCAKCEILQKNAKFVQCIDIMEEIVTIKKNYYGIDHPQFDQASEKLCEYLNLAAMVELQKQKFQQTLDHLRKAELVARNSLPLKSTTFNNLACFYRKTGKVRTALSYLIQALEIQLKIEQPKTLADTHLNLCAVLSQLDRHEDALQHSMLSIILLQDQFLSKLLKNQTENNSEFQISDERLAILSIAYHNLGVEFQHLKRFDEALKIYKKALKFSKDNLSNNQQLVKNLAEVVDSASEQIQEQKRNYLESNHAKLSKEIEQDKKNIYKDLSKTVERYRHLPKVKNNIKQNHPLFSDLDPQTYQSINIHDHNENYGRKTAISKGKGYMVRKTANNKTRYKATPESSLKVRGKLGSRTNREKQTYKQEEYQY